MIFFLIECSFLQGGHIKIHLNSDIPVQVDGEPWVQSPCDVVVLKSALKVNITYNISNFQGESIHTIHIDLGCYCVDI